MSRASLRFFMALAVARCLTLSPVQAEPSSGERVEWNKSPIAVTLKVNVETRLQFPSPVKVGVPASLKSELRIQSVGDTVYLKPSAAFESTRLVIQTRDGAHTYLVDVSSSDTADGPKLLRIVDAEQERAYEQPAAPSGEPTAPGQDPVSLTRFAAQQLYAPERLVAHPGNVVREPLNPKTVSLVRGGTVTALPLIAWRSGRLHVTVVKLVNTSQVPTTLDPRSLRGAWLTATFQHNRLLANGDEADTTVVYLVSEQPFAASF